MNTTTPRVHATGKPRTDDGRDFSHFRVYGTVNDLATLPRNGLGRRPLFGIKDQKDTSFCTAFATAGASEYQEKVQLSPEFQAAKIGQLMGAPILNGADPRVALQAAVAYGSLEQADAPWTLANKPPEFVADYKNWPAELTPKAAVHAKDSFFDALDGPHVLFGNALVSLFKAKADNGVLVCTSQWFENWNDTQTFGWSLPVGLNPYGWHDYDIIDWRQNPSTFELELVLQNSYGSTFGDQGLCYVPAATFNAAFAVKGAGASIFRDIDPAVAKQILQRNASLFGVFFQLMRRLGIPTDAALKALTILFPFTGKITI